MFAGCTTHHIVHESSGKTAFDVVEATGIRDFHSEYAACTAYTETVAEKTVFFFFF